MEKGNNQSELKNTVLSRLCYLLTPWCRVLLEKLTGLQLVKKFPAFHGTRKFITALTSVRHLSLPWASPIQSIYPHTTSWRSVLTLSTHLRLGLPSGSFPPVSPSRPYTPSLLTHTRHMPSPSHSSRFYRKKWDGLGMWRVRQTKNENKRQMSGRMNSDSHKTVTVTADCIDKKYLMVYYIKCELNYFCRSCYNGNSHNISYLYIT